MGRPDGSDSELIDPAEGRFLYIFDHDFFDPISLIMMASTMTGIAAIQMTSGPDVTANLEQAQPLL